MITNIHRNESETSLKKIAIGNRHNLFYLLMLMTFIILQKLVMEIFDYFIDKINLFIVCSLLNFLSTFIFSFIIVIIESKTTESSEGQKKKNNPDNNDLIVKDSSKKIIILVFFSAFFNFAKNIGQKILKIFVDEQTLRNMKIRSIEICISSFLSYFLLNIKLSRHHRISLYIIFFILFLILISHLILIDNPSWETIKLFLIVFYLNLCQVLNDIIQKYLMEKVYFNPHKLLLTQGIFELIFSLFILLLDLYKTEFKILIIVLKEKSFGMSIFAIFLLFMYFIFSGFRNVYEILTLKVYSPTTLALAESIKDPLLIIRNLLFNFGKIKEFLFWLNFIGSCITFFFSLVYNEFLILYCCNLAYNTHIEITQRAEEKDLLEVRGNIVN